MANEWKWLRGPKQTIYVNNNSVAKNKGTPCSFTSHLAVGCADGGTVDIVLEQDATANQTHVLACMPNGDIYSVNVPSGTTIYLSAAAYMAASNAVDAGAANQNSHMMFVDYDPASAGSCAHIAVWSAKGFPNYYGQDDTT
jgi:hypothetical protein